MQQRTTAGPSLLPPSGWESVARLVWVRKTSLPNPLSHNRPLPILTSGVKDDNELLFLDTETTGLSGGAGTMAFLVGIGRPQGSDFQVTQYFVVDYPGETELIRLLSQELGGRKTVVSYNGKSFDLPILKGRFALSGVRLEVCAQIDLLHTARRLWRNTLGACSLRAIEEQVLGVTRREDVPGSLVPELYFDFLRSGNLNELRAVFSHHLYDVASLADLLDYIETIPKRPPGSGFVDFVELGRIMLDHGLPEGAAILRESALTGDLLAARAVSRYLKRMARWPEAVEIWSHMWERSSSYFAGVELAKYYEHRSREYRRALDLVDKISMMALGRSRWATAARADTIKRRSRLLDKVSRNERRG